ncbi:MAG: hypothetical protein JWM88_301 [Verrucomicrobia bacterium]|nr:hypothetical protein [Verrucomicrobiota bacterium]
MVLLFRGMSVAPIVERRYLPASKNGLNAKIAKSAKERAGRAFLALFAIFVVGAFLPGLPAFNCGVRLTNPERAQFRLPLALSSGDHRQIRRLSSPRNPALTVLRVDAPLRFLAPLPGGVKVAQATLTRLVMVRILAGQPFDAGRAMLGLCSWQALRRAAGVECPEQAQRVEGLSTDGATAHPLLELRIRNRPRLEQRHCASAFGPCDRVPSC